MQLQPASTDRPLESLDAAFVGIPRAVVGHVRRSSEDLAIVRFEVTESIKGTMGEDAFVLVKDSSDSCGEPRLTPGGIQWGKEAGIQIWNPGVPIALEACTSTEPAYVRSGIPGLDQPVRGSPAVAIAVGEHRGTSVRLLNENAQVMTYIEADGSAASPALCNDGETLATLTDGPTMQWRSLQTLAVVGEADVTGAPSELRELSIDRCVDANSAVIRTNSQQWLANPDGTVIELPTGQNNSGTISADGSTFARWNDTFEFEVLAVDDLAATGQKVSVSNHRGQDLEISPDGTMFAFYRRKPPLSRADMEVVIVDAAGTELHVLLDPSFFTLYGFRWLDDQSLAVGTAIVDLSADPVTISDPEDSVYDRLRLQHLGIRAMAFDDPADQWVIADITNGTSAFFAERSQPFYGRLLALAAPITPSEGGLIPGPRPSTPLAGDSLPATFGDMVELVDAHEDLTLNARFRDRLPEISAGLGALFTMWVRRRRRVRFIR